MGRPLVFFMASTMSNTLYPIPVPKLNTEYFWNPLLVTSESGDIYCRALT
jgi:hypothetical protein